MPHSKQETPPKKSQANLPWFRMYHEIIDDAKMRLLSPDCRWYYVGILCCKAQGILDDHDGDLQWRMVAVKLGVTKDHLFDVVEELVEVGLIDRDTLQPMAWQKRQFRSDADPTAAERQRRYREKSKEKQGSRVTDRNGNGRVTLTDTDTEADKDTDKSKHIGQQADRFDLFWSAYPRKVKKAEARKVWKSRKLDRLADQIVTDIQTRQQMDRQWLEGYVPHPTTYLRGARWEDDIEQPKRVESAVERATREALEWRQSHGQA